MTRTLIGIDSQGVASVKISTDAYDPVTTPDTTYGAWLYNSKHQPIRFNGADTIFVTGGSGTAFYPPGTNRDNFQRAIEGGRNWYYRKSFFSGLHYNMPLFEEKLVQTSNGRFNARIVQERYGFENRSGYFASPGAWGADWRSDYTDRLFTSISSIGYGCRSYPRDGFNKILQVWDLSGNADPLLDPPLAPVPGQSSVIIDAATCRVAKPGYDANTASETQLAFDSAVLPIKVVAAGDVAVPSGNASVSAGGAPDDCLVDIHFYNGSDIYYPVHPLNSDDPRMGAEHWLSGGNLNFYNDRGACRARYMVYARNNAAPTYGGNDVLRQFHDGAQNVVQFLRPGAGPDPAFADIILDSRWPAVRIIAEGYIPVTADGERQWTIGFDAGNAWPFVKYMTVHSGTNQSSYSCSGAVRQPFYKGLYSGRPQSPTLYMSGDATYCRLTQSEAHFHTNRGAPTRIFYADAQDYGSGTRSHRYDETPIQGIRYYIFGIPQP